MILWSKGLVTIDKNVNIELDLQQMIAGQPDCDALRALFSELEFTTLLKELAPTTEARETDYRELKSVEDLRKLSQARAPLAIAFEFTALAPAETEDQEEAEEEQKSGNLPFTQMSLTADAGPTPLKIAFSAEPGKAFTASLDGDEISRD